MTSVHQMYTKHAKTDWWTYVGELAHRVGFDGNVVLFEFLLDLINACGDVFGL